MQFKEEILPSLLPIIIGAVMVVQELNLFQLPFQVPNVAFGIAVVVAGVLGIWLATS